MNKPTRSWLLLLPFLAMLGLLITGLTRVANATSHYVLTAPTANSVWQAGTALTIQWTGGPPATPVKLVLADVPSWTTAATIGVNLPNTGTYTWTIPANLPTSTYLIYIEAMDQSTWQYGPHFTIEAAHTNVRPDLSITKRPVDPLLAGQNTAYNLLVTNVGSGPAAGPITVTDTLGAGLSFVSATGSGWTCSAAGQTVTCVQPGPLAAGQSLPLLTLTVAISADVTVAENCASVATGHDAATPGDGNPENDRTCVKGEVTPPPVGDPCGVKFEDLNGNGTQDPGEPGLSGWTIQITDAMGNVVTTTVTGRGGRFCFKDVKAGTYTVSEVQQAGWSQTAPAASGTYTVALGGAAGATPMLMFGNQQQLATGGLCGIKFNDLNGNGIQDPGELGMPGWTIEITDATGNVIAQLVTDDEGRFCYKELPLGTYTISEVNQAGWTQTYPASGSYTVTLDAANPTWESLLFGNRKSVIPGSLCGVKFNDLNGNGIQDTGELGLPGWNIQAKDAQGNLIAQAVSDRNGKFCFGKLRPGLYTFSEVMQAGWTQTFPSAPGTHTVNVVGGQNNTTISFGNQKQEEPCCLTSQLTAGKADGFSTAGAPEGSYPSLALLQALNLSTHANFDITQLDRTFAHTFWIPAGNCLKGARLEIKAKPLGNGFTVANDTIGLRFSGLPGSPTWSSYFGGGQSSLGLVANQWSQTNYSGGQTFTLDLGNLPGGTNLLPWLQAQRFLDVTVQDDTSIDYLALNLEFCECDDVTEPVGETVSVVAKTVVQLQLDSVEATVNGEARQMAAAAVLRNSSTLVPLRWIGQALGAEIQWNGDERKVTFLQGGRVVEVWIDRSVGMVDGIDTTLPVSPTLINSSTYVPLRFISEALGADVRYEPSDRSITINYQL